MRPVPGPDARALAGAGMLAVVLMLSIVPLPAHGSPPSLGAPPRLLPRNAVAGPCAGSSERTGVNGTLSTLGNATPRPSDAGVGLTLEFAYEVEFIPSGHPAQYSCATGTATTTTNAAGAFSVNATLPAGGCTSRSCTEYYGPFSPENLTLTGAAPVGYFLSGAVAWPQTHLSFVSAFEHLRIDPAGPRVVSVSAPIVESAVATAADGSPSPGSLVDNWSVSSPQWSITNDSGASTVLTAPPTAQSGILTLTTNDTLGGHRLTQRSAQIGVDAIATSVGSAEAASTTLDVGEETTVTVDGTGAQGYNYTMTLSPGLNATPVSTNCTATLENGGLLGLACSVPLRYAQAGTARPVANLTNGYSSASASVGSLAVHSGLELTVEPDPFRAYAGTTSTLVVAVAEGTGTGPYGPACLDLGTGNRSCQELEGGPWSFPVVYGAAGAYRATVHVADAAGVNASLAVPVTIGTRPSLGALEASSATVPYGGSVELTATVTGGLGPMGYWFNRSAPASNVGSGSLNASGVIRLDYTPAGEGNETITLTVVDALGTRIATTLWLVVLAGPAVEISEAPQSPLVRTMSAGSPAAFSLIALSPRSERVPDYTGNVTVSFPPASGAAGPVWLNTTAGAVAPDGAGVFSLPASDWFAGYLNFTLTALRAGSYDLVVGAGLPLTFTSTGTLAEEVRCAVGALEVVPPIALPAEGRTGALRWYLADPFGNPAPAGTAWLLGSFGGVETNSTIPILTNGTSSWLWVNFSAPGLEAGSYRVLTEWGEALGPTIAVPAGTALLSPGVVLGAGLAVAGIVAAGVVARRRRPGPEGPGEEESEEATMRRYAEGRAALLERIRAEGPLDFEGAVGGGDPPPPDRGEAAEWLASLVTEGLVRAEPDADGTTRFVGAPAAERPGRLRVEYDPTALPAGGAEAEGDEGLPDGAGD